MNSSKTSLNKIIFSDVNKTLFKSCFLTLLLSVGAVSADSTGLRPFLVTPQPDGSIVAQAADASVEGETFKQPNLLPVKDRFGFEGTRAVTWGLGDTRLVWRIPIETPADYDVLVDYSGPREAFAEVTVGEARLRKERFGAAARRIHNLGRLALNPGTPLLTFDFGRLASSTESREMKILFHALILSPANASLATRTERELREYLLPILERKPVTELSLPGIFSDHMVLQRDMPVPVWGLAKPGQTVTVTFAGQSKTAVPDRFGRWLLHLDPMSASCASRDLVINASPVSSRLTFRDVLVGDVWLGSGQSNMEIGVDAPKGWARHTGAEALIGKKDFPLIRTSSHCPRYFKTPNGGWVTATHENIFQTSAMMVCSMVPLQEKLGIPVGIMVRALSNSASSPWIDLDAIAASAEIQEQIADYAAGGYDQAWAAAVEKTAAQNTVPTIPYSAPPWPGMSRWRSDGIGELWQSLVEPIVPYAIKGVLWDQGESGTDIGGTTHDTVQPVLIKAWRKAWGQGEFPFVHIQKNNYDAKTLAAIAAVPNTFMVSNKDLDQRLHPVDKDKYGARAAAVILENCYGK